MAAKSQFARNLSIARPANCTREKSRSRWSNTTSATDGAVHTPGSSAAVRSNVRRNSAGVSWEAEHIERWISEHHRDARAIASAYGASRADAHRRLHHGFDHFLMA
jgi:hypothetical protein